MRADTDNREIHRPTPHARAIDTLLLQTPQIRTIFHVHDPLLRLLSPAQDRPRDLRPVKRKNPGAPRGGEPGFRIVTAGRGHAPIRSAADAAATMPSLIAAPRPRRHHINEQRSPAGVLAYGSNYWPRLLRDFANGSCGVRPRSQRRVHGGFAPPSLSSDQRPDTGNRDLFTCQSTGRVQLRAYSLQRPAGVVK